MDESGREELAAVLLSGAEARRLTDQVKRDAADLWRRLNDLYERGAYIALGYSSWADYCGEEFGLGKAHAYRLLAAARTLGEIEAQSPRGDSPPITERQARELARSPEPAKAWRTAQEAHGPNPPAPAIRETVEGQARRVLTYTQSSQAPGAPSTPPPARHRPEPDWPDVRRWRAMAERDTCPCCLKPWDEGEVA
jgi:hypothetical protein